MTLILSVCEIGIWFQNLVVLVVPACAGPCAACAKACADPGFQKDFPKSRILCFFCFGGEHRQLGFVVG